MVYPWMILQSYRPQVSNRQFSFLFNKNIKHPPIITFVELSDLLGHPHRQTLKGGCDSNCDGTRRQRDHYFHLCLWVSFWHLFDQVQIDGPWGWTLGWQWPGFSFKSLFQHLFGLLFIVLVSNLLCQPVSIQIKIMIGMCAL